MTNSIKRPWRATAITLGLGLAGAAIAWLIGIPLAFITGPVLAMLLSSRTSLTLHVKPVLKLIAFVFVGIYLGSQFSPSFFSDIGGWWPTFVLNMLMTFTIIILGTVLLMHLLKYSFATSSFSSIPGGVLAVLESAIESDADNETVVFLQIFRTALAAILIPLGIKLSGYEISATAIVEQTSHAIHWFDWLILLVAAFLSAIIASKARVPSGALVAPMLVTAMLVISQVVTITVPKLPVAAAFIVVGSAIGADLPRPDSKTFVKLLGQSMVLFAMMIFVTAIFAYFTAKFADLAYVEVFLAFAPAGLTQATVIAATLNLDVGFIAANNLVRMVLCSVLAPLILIFWKRKYATT